MREREREREREIVSHKSNITLRKPFQRFIISNPQNFFFQLWQQYGFD